MTSPWPPPSVPDETRVAIAMIDPGFVVHETTQSLIAIMSTKNPYQRPSHVMMKRSGALIQWARNQLTEDFLQQTDAEWLLWIDADIEFPQNTISRMLEVATEANVQVVGCMYVHPMAERMKPSVFFYRQLPDVPGKSMDAIHMEDVASLREQGMTWIYADGTGAGCLMIHRDLLERVKNKAMEYKDAEPWFTTRVIDGVFFGEDLAFCHRLRQLGERLAVVLDVDLGHIKQVVYKPTAPVVI